MSTRNYEMHKKIAKLTKVIYDLNIRNEKYKEELELQNKRWKKEEDCANNKYRDDICKLREK